MKRLFLAGAAAALLLPTLAVSAEPATASRAPCFFVSQFRGWRSPDPSTLYLGVNVRDVYEVKLSAPSPQLSWAGSHLVLKVRGSSSICSPLDLDLRVSQGRGMSTPVIAKSLRKLTPEEVAALPKKDRPY